MMFFLKMQDWARRRLLAIAATGLLLSLNLSCGDTPEPIDQEVPILLLRSPQLVQQDALVKFDATGSTDDWGIVRFAAEFGDGSAKQNFTSLHFSHRYHSPGTFSLFLQAFDDAGHVASMRRHVTVVEHLWPPYCAEDAGLTCTADAVCSDGLCFVEGDSSDSD